MSINYKIARRRIVSAIPEASARPGQRTNVTYAISAGIATDYVRPLDLHSRDRSIFYSIRSLTARNGSVPTIHPRLALLVDAIPATTHAESVPLISPLSYPSSRDPAAQKPVQFSRFARIFGLFCVLIAQMTLSLVARRSARCFVSF